MAAGEGPARDRIEIRGLRALGVHGVLPEERDRPQPFEVDLDMVLDATRAAATDWLGDTADYGALAERAGRVVSTSSFRLLEALAAAVASEVLGAEPRVVEVAATVRKLRPPIPLDIASVGVRVVRSRTAPAPEAERLRTRAFLGLGSNLGDRRAHLSAAVAELRKAGDLVAVSPVYETEPIGGPEGQPAYLNVVVELATADGPRQLLERCRALESAAGRVRKVRFGPRTLDADVLLVGQAVVDDEDLQVPHPRMWERRFVLAPLSDLASELVAADALAAAHGQVTRLGTL